jgi:hypothetical protein
MFQQAESTALTGIHIPIHSNVGYGVLPIACSAVRALPCRKLLQWEAF